MNNERNARLEDRNSPHFSIAHIIRRIQREGFYVIKLDEPINPEDLEQAMVSMRDEIKTGVAKYVCQLLGSPNDSGMELSTSSRRR